MAKGLSRPAWIEIDVDALIHNAAVMKRIANPALLCAVVKADGYGHGAITSAQAFLEGGADWLAVAIGDEGVELRQAGITAPILVLAEPHSDAFDDVIDCDLAVTVVHDEVVVNLGRRAAAKNKTVIVHPKIDTGMHRVGKFGAQLDDLLGVIEKTDGVSLGGVWTHFADADKVTDEGVRFTNGQIKQFVDATKNIEGDIIRHAANSAGAIGFPHGRFDMVRCGISLYGVLPHQDMDSQFAAASGGARLKPALSLRAQVSQVQKLEVGARPSYGRHRALEKASFIATVPIGYADGVQRRLFGKKVPVLIGEKRRALAGMVTMDQIVVDCDDGPVSIGDDVTLLGSQGSETVSAEEWAVSLGTISYEVFCLLGTRLPRKVIRAS